MKLDPHECHPCMQKMMGSPMILADVRIHDVRERWVVKVLPTLYPKVLYNIHSQVSTEWWSCINRVQASTCALSGFPTTLGMTLTSKLFLQTTPLNNFKAFVL